MRRIGTNDRIVIIGGGISGLSSAFYLQREAERQGLNVQITLVEAADSLGGKINTLQRDGFVIEKGPDSFLARKLAMIELAKELGLESELTSTNPEAKKTYIMHRRKLHPMPPGLVLGVPTEIGPFLRSGLLSWSGKLRALLDLTLPARKEQGDESLGGFIERRVGTEVMRRIAEPLLAGIYAGDLKKLSLQATFPQFAASERKFGSLIKGMRSSRKATAAANAAAGASAGTGGAGTSTSGADAGQSKQGSVFMTFKGGLSTLVQALEQALLDSGVELRLGARVTGLHRAPDSSREHEGNREVRELDDNNGVLEGNRDDRELGGNNEPGDYVIEIAGGGSLRANRVVITSQAYHAAALLEQLVHCAELRSVRYVSVANVVMAFDKKSLGLEFDGSGFLVPRSEGLHITACTWTSSKWLHTSPPDKVLLRCYVGHSEDQESVKLPDDKLIAAVRQDMKEALGITAEPLFTEITRLDHSMPQYPVGHVEHMKQLRERLERELPGVWITGAAFDGVGLPDCIRQGKEAAKACFSTDSKV